MLEKEKLINDFTAIKYKFMLKNQAFCMKIYGRQEHLNCRKDINEKEIRYSKDHDKTDMEPFMKEFQELKQLIIKEKHSAEEKAKYESEKQRKFVDILDSCCKNLTGNA